MTEKLYEQKTLESIQTFKSSLKIAVLLPCYNEEKAIAQVVADFKQALPHADIYVYDNASTDRTIEVAHQAGAIVRSVLPKGKGQVVRRMFADIDADIYVLADGDHTYDAAAAPSLISKLLQDRLDMVVGTRVEIDNSAQAYRPGHRFGNAFFTNAVGYLFGKQFSDILSGYRVFSRRFIKSFPALSEGFDIETELTIHSLELGLPVGEVKTQYRERPAGTVSKLNKYRDGVVILGRLLLMLKEARPFFFFSMIASLLILLAIVLAVPLLVTFLKIGLVPRLPTAILTVGLMILGCMSLTCGIILDSVSRARRERKYMHYLSLNWLNKAFRGQ